MDTEIEKLQAEIEQLKAQLKEEQGLHKMYGDLSSDYFKSASDRLEFIKALGLMAQAAEEEAIDSKESARLKLIIHTIDQYVYRESCVQLKR